MRSQITDSSAPRVPYRIAGVAGGILAVIIPGGFWLFSYIPSQTSFPDVAKWSIAAYAFWHFASPFLALTGAILSSLKVIHAPHPPIGSVISLFLNIASLLLVLSLLVTNFGSVGARRVQRTMALAGTLDQAAGIYRSPAGSWQIQIKRLGARTLTDHYDKEKKHESARLGDGTRQWLIEAMPGESAGLPPTVSSREFVEALSRKVSYPNTISIEKRVPLTGIPALRVYSKPDSPESSGEIILLDQAYLNGTYYRLGVMAKGDDPAAVKTALEQDLAALWSAVIFPPAEPRPAPSKEAK